MIERRLDALEKAPRQTDSIDNASAHDPAVVTEEAGISSTPLPGSGGSSGSNAAGLEPRGTEHSTLNLISNLGMFPATSVGSNTSPDVDLPTMDIISRGVVSLDVAEELLAYYYRHLNCFLHHVLNERDTLADIRARSSLLAAAICTVSSFCSSPDLYNACYGVFVNEVSSRLFAPHSSYDDVRALCIASMWLEEIGPTLIALGRSNRCTSRCSHTDIVLSGSHWWTIRLAPMRHKNAAHKSRMLRPDSIVLSAVPLRSSLFAQVWPPANDARLAVIEESDDVPSFRVL